MNALTIAMAQLSLRVGDIEGNTDRIVAAARQANDVHGAGLVVCPEMALLGYPADDLLLRQGLPDAIASGLKRLANELPTVPVIVGFPEFVADTVYNSAVLLQGGQQCAVYRKQYLPNYGVFDEKRHYQSGDQACVVDIANTRVGITICEDLFETAPAAQARAHGAELLVNLSASPFEQGKQAERETVMAARVRDTGLPIVYTNCVGGQDELVFDGGSMALASDGLQCLKTPAFASGVYPVTLRAGELAETHDAEETEPDALTYQALISALRDYVDGNGFKGVLVGLSGGIDSALTVTIAVDALGPERVWAVSMPSRYTADISNEDAAGLAQALGIRYDELSIESVFNSYLDTLAPLFEGQQADTTEENLQPRARGMLLMALSNKFGQVVLAPGNKSEMAVGYSTIYGDMCGGFAPLKDVYKTSVYRLARYRNQCSAVIPERIIERPPSAELRAGQTDADSLPDYPELDAILHAYIEAGLSIHGICARGYSESTVRRVVGLVRGAEYKRRQAPPGPKVTRMAFGRERRYPITATYGDL